MSSKNKNIESPSSPLKRSLVMFSWLSVLAVGLWALMHYSTPESNLEPYKRFQEAKAEHANTERENTERKNAELEKPGFTLLSNL
ncbi:uncharacterized protein METZ01_LOCUS323290, partial [marine metagenome]